MNANERFEKLAAEFYKDTGMLPPGKDDPFTSRTREERTKAWEEWLNKPKTDS